MTQARDLFRWCARNSERYKRGLDHDGGGVSFLHLCMNGLCASVLSQCRDTHPPALLLGILGPSQIAGNERPGTGKAVPEGY